jgi:cGMP-dependent protein kinase
VSVIGCGTFGSVRCVEHRKTRFRYALKRVKLTDGKVPELVARERDLLAEVSHPFILRLAGAFDTKAGAYLLTELLTGGELLAALDDIGRVLTRTEAQFYAGSLILALEVLHEANIVFRDLKPENVMLDARGYLRLIDFGVAKQLDSSCRTFTIIGSFHFMAPEVACGKGYSTEADIWSLGVMLFEFVCGILPFGRDLPANSPHAILRAVQTDNLAFPDHYRDNIGKHCIRGMLRKEPERRLGAGINGFEAIKSHDFFALAEGGSSLFDRILSRAVQPPYIPQREIYGDPDTLREVTLSDSERFA